MTLPIDTAELVERFQGGASVSTLATAYRCSQRTVLYRLNQAGARRSPRVNIRALLKTHGPVLSGLLVQLQRALTAVREEFASQVQTPAIRKKYMARIERLEEQIAALQSLTGR
jgi:hypothetical protein